MKCVPNPLGYLYNLQSHISGPVGPRGLLQGIMNVYGLTPCHAGGPAYIQTNLYSQNECEACYGGQPTCWGAKSEMEMAKMAKQRK